MRRICAGFLIATAIVIGLGVWLTRETRVMPPAVSYPPPHCLGSDSANRWCVK